MELRHVQLDVFSPQITETATVFLCLANRAFALHNHSQLIHLVDISAVKYKSTRRCARKLKSLALVRCVLGGGCFEIALSVRGVLIRKRRRVHTVFLRIADPVCVVRQTLR